jgi:hypothetical protein
VPRTSRGGTDRGSVTAEAAVVLPVLVAAFALCLGGVATVTAELRCVDAARTAARGLARGEPVAAAVAAARAEAPAGAEVAVARQADDVAVTVRVVVPLLGLRRAVGIPVHATEHAVPEPGAAP